MSETIIQSRICAKCSETFHITDVDQDFLDRLAPSFGSPAEKGGMGVQKFPLPFPTLCPRCRKIRRYAWRNEKNIYKRTCDATGKTIISLFSPEAPCPVYESEYWYSDKWDARSYGQDFDFSRPFFEQWGELKKVVPMPGKAISNGMENSDYSDNCSNLRNCYLVFNASECEECLYSTDIWNCRRIVDSLSLYNCEDSYELLDARDCHAVHFSHDVNTCRGSYFLTDCYGCSDCYGCFGLKNQKYHIYNTPYNESEYHRKLGKILTVSFDDQKRIYEKFLKEKGYNPILSKVIRSENVSDSTRVFDSKNVSHSEIINNCEDIRYSSGLLDTRMALDVDIWGERLDRTYECIIVGEASSNLHFSLCIWANTSDLLYCAYCINNVQDCFGCIGLRNARYCILNKQYTKQEYEVLVPRIIEHMRKTGEWGEFFPASLSHFGYNQTMNMIVKPLTREEVLENLLEKVCLVGRQGGGSIEDGIGGLAVGDNISQKNQQRDQSSVPNNSGQLLSQGALNNTFLHGPTFNWSDYEAPFPKVERTIPADKLPEDITDIPDDILNWAIECEVSEKPFRIMKQELEFYRKHHLPIPRKHPDVRYKERTKLYINY